MGSRRLAPSRLHDDAEATAERPCHHLGWTQYAFTFDATAGTKELRVAFDNDYLTSTEDRNLRVDKVVVGCPSP